MKYIFHIQHNNAFLLDMFCQKKKKNTKKENTCSIITKETILTYQNQRAWSVCEMGYLAKQTAIARDGI